MSIFTQGKWSACVDWSVDILDGKGRVIGTFCDIVGAHEEGETMANARLIASAPRMYELLQEAFLALQRADADEPLRFAIDECLCRITGEVK